MYSQASHNSSPTCSRSPGRAVTRRFPASGRARVGVAASGIRRGTLRKISKASFITALVFLIGHLAQAQNRSIKVVLDPAQTEIHWKLSGLHSTHGTFKLKSGEFLFNPTNGPGRRARFWWTQPPARAETQPAINACRTRCWRAIVIRPSSFIRPKSKGRFQAGEGDAGPGGGRHLQHPRSGSSTGAAAQSANQRRHRHRNYALHGSLCGVGNEESQ